MKAIGYLSFFSACSILTACNSKEAKENKTGKPNIIFIICDDLNDAIGSLQGHPQVRTPNLDRLANMGVNFVNAQVNAPICGPSRESILTGLYPHTTGYYGYNFIKDHWKNNPTLSSSITFMEHFRNNGYKVLGTGKIFHNSQEDYTVYDEFGIPPTHGPWPWDGTPDDYYMFGSLAPWGNSVLHPDFPDYFDKGEQFGPLSNVPVVPPDPENNIPGYSGWRLFFKKFIYKDKDNRDLMPDELNAKWTIEKLQEEHDKPFMICVGINRPHAPMWAPDEFFDMYGLDTLKITEILENDTIDISKSFYHSEGFPLSRYKRIVENGLLKEWTRAYLANVSFLDVQIGNILDGLEKSKYADNTYIFFTSDHGMHMGEKNWLFKNSVWEESARVPLLVTGPGIPKGRKCIQPVSLIDLYPTFNELANISKSPNDQANQVSIDGHSLVPLMENPEKGKWDGPDVAITAVRGNDKLELGEPGKKEKQFFSLRSERYRYIICPNGEEELYDHEVDPNEWKNVVNEPGYKNTLDEFRKKFKKLVLEN
jgi:arylsulfatase A-like enzyme